MAADVSKHLDRAKRFLEKNRVEDAIAAYKAVLDESPQHQEATQALGDLYARADQPDRASVYYGLLFDMLVDPRDESKALAIYNRFLRSAALLYAEATLRAGDAKQAAALLEQFAATDSDATFLDTFADALMRSGQLDRAREILERLLKDKNQGFSRFFDLVDVYGKAGQDSKSVEVLQVIKGRMYADGKQNDFIAQLDSVGGKHSNSQAILEYCAKFYIEANRETQYFEILIKLFDLYLKAGNVDKASDALEKLQIKK